MNQPFSNNKSFRSPFILFLLGAVLFLSIGFSYFNLSYKAQFIHYRIFDFKEAFSWRKINDKIFRISSKENLDTTLFSQDSWQEYTLSFTLLNPYQAGIIFSYQDKNNFHFLYFDEQAKAVLGGSNNKGEVKLFKRIPAQIAGYNFCQLKVAGNGVELFVNGKPILNEKGDYPQGRFGIMIREVKGASAIFANVLIQGKLNTGKFIEATESQSHKSQFTGYFVNLGFLYILCIVMYFYLAKVFSYQLKNQKRYKEIKKEDSLNIFAVLAIHLGLAAIVFWPFVRYGHVLISSSDNYGEIFPLFFLSKHNFWDILSGQSLSLWNPYAHNGIPFFSNHWNMVYYPLNWIVFLFPDEKILSALSFKTVIEVFLIGALSFGFFSIELGSKRWALLCSIVYQLCSFLIFSVTVFPTTSLYFAMTLFVYCLWSAVKKTVLRNYLLLTFSVVLILTSANVAFIFYAVLALMVISIYRIFTVSKLRSERFYTFGLLAVSVVTGGLIAAVRIISCYWGVMQSNRLVDNYYTLHDRLELVIRSFLPEIVGWFNIDSFNALTSENLNLIFRQANLPSNSQNAFFAYFGVIPALILLFNLFISAKGKHLFWKGYFVLALAICLLVQPIWGIISVLFFPMNHYSYPIIILPIGFCMLLGHTGCFLEKRKYSFKGIIHKFGIAAVLVQTFLIVFVTYLFPQLTNPMRAVLVFIVMWLAGYTYLHHHNHSLRNKFYSLTAIFVQIVLSAVMFFLMTAWLIRPVPVKEDATALLFIPFGLILLVVNGALCAYFLRYHNKAKTKLLPQVVFCLLCGFMFFLVMKGMSSQGFAGFLNMEAKYLVYFQDVIFGQVRFLWSVFIVVSVIALFYLKIISANWLKNLFIFLILIDLLVFNARFDNVVASNPYYNAYSRVVFPYFSFDPQIQEKMDLVNYRCNNLHKVSINGNRNFIFGIPSYTGIMGYMPQRFSNFINNFGYPKGTILLYTSDSTSDERFLDLSAVKYDFDDNANLIIRPNALSRVMLYDSYEVMNEGNILLKLKDEGFKPLETVLLSSKPQIVSAQNAQPAKIVGIEKATSDEIFLSFETPRPAILLFNETYSEGWKAYVDKAKTPVLRANYNFMAIEVPSGGHKVIFTYKPQIFFNLIYVSMVGFCLLIGVSIFLYRLGRKK